MDIADHIEQLKKLSAFAATQVVNSVIVPAANELLAETKNRIILDGKDSNNAQIGYYSTKPGYYSQQQFVVGGAFKGIGKNGGTPRKSMYLSGGYKQFRNIQGRETGKVNVTLSGDTNQRYQLEQRSGSIIFGMTTKKASDIRKGQEKKFGKRIYPSTQTELDNYNKNVAEGFKQATVDILSGI